MLQVRKAGFKELTALSVDEAVEEDNGTVLEHRQFLAELDPQSLSCIYSHIHQNTGAQMLAALYL